VLGARPCLDLGFSVDDDSGGGKTLAPEASLGREQKEASRGRYRLGAPRSRGPQTEEVPIKNPQRVEPQGLVDREDEGPAYLYMHLPRPYQVGSVGPDQATSIPKRFSPFPASAYVGC